MKAVWSFWTKPYSLIRQSVWFSDLHHLLSWVLSFETSQRYFDKTELVTDDAGAYLLINQLGLAFDNVTTSLNRLDHYDPVWWAVGKLYTYRNQTEPFVHIDSDAYLWKPLPIKPDTAVFAQNPEPALSPKCYYYPELLETLIENGKQGWLPEEWVWYRANRSPQIGIACGLFGGNHVEFIQYYADRAIRLIEYPGNQAVWRQLDKRAERNILAEQFLLPACLEYQQQHPKSPFENLSIEFLFPSMADSFNETKAAEAGYTHLIAACKRNKSIVDKLEQRVKADYPAAYERCLSICCKRSIWTH